MLHIMSNASIIGTPATIQQAALADLQEVENKLDAWGRQTANGYARRVYKAASNAVGRVRRKYELKGGGK